MSFEINKKITHFAAVDVTPEEPNTTPTGNPKDDFFGLKFLDKSIEKSSLKFKFNKSAGISDERFFLIMKIWENLF